MGKHVTFPDILRKKVQTFFEGFFPLRFSLHSDLCIIPREDTAYTQVGPLYT